MSPIFIDPRTVTAAMDSVLTAAVARQDDSLIEAYREIYQGINPRKGDEEQRRHAALRLGILIGLEIRK